MEYIRLFVTIWMKFSFLFTPFLALSIFLGMTEKYETLERRKLAIRVMVAVLILCIGFFFFGKVVFKLFGITLDSFRVGAGALLFLSAVQLVQSRQQAFPATENKEDDIAVVPLAMPIVIGPAIIGTLFVLGADLNTSRERIIGVLALGAASLTLGVILLMGEHIERVIGKRNLRIISKVTGLILAAIAAQMILSGTIKPS